MDTWQRKKRISPILVIIFTGLLTAMYANNYNGVSLGSINFLYNRLFAAIIVVISFIVFLVGGNLRRGKVLIVDTFMISLPFIVALVYSAFLWTVNAADSAIVRKGLFENLYLILAVLAMTGVVYCFGKKGMLINTLAMVLANMITVVRIVQKNGFSAFWSEMKATVTTFAKETGDLMVAAEIHELTFAISLALVILIFTYKSWKKDLLMWILFFMSLFCTLTGFKRIAAIAAGAAFLVGILFILPKDDRIEVPGKKPKTGLTMALILSWIIVIVCFAYVAFVRSGMFETVTDKLDIKTLGRTEMYDKIEEYYTFSPKYLGRGAGFVSYYFDLLSQAVVSDIQALHNDILHVYIDIGFVGMGLWLIAYIPMRIGYFYKKHGNRTGLIALIGTVFLIVTATTDNTLFYIYPMAVLSVATMSFDIERAEEKEPLTREEAEEARERQREDDAARKRNSTSLQDRKIPE